jgi:transposase
MNYRPYLPDQQELFGYRPQDFLEENHQAYFIDEVVEELDTSVFFDRVFGPGNEAYDPRLMLKVLFYGYATGTFSSRKLARNCRESLPYIYLCRGQRPKYRALCYFREHNGEKIKELFLQILKVAEGMCILKVGHLILDGTVIKANAKKDRVIKSKDYDGFLESIESYLKQAWEADKHEEDSSGVTLPKKLARKSKRVKHLREVIQKAKQEEKKIASPTDPEAPFMKLKQKRGIDLGYNFQVGVDAESGLVTACDVNDKHYDNQCLGQMAKQVEENLGKPIKKLDGDSGYYKPDEIAGLEARGIDTAIPDQALAGKLHYKKSLDELGFSKEDFEYDKASDGYRCPGGRKLRFRTSRKRNEELVRVYRTEVSCIDCELHDKCFSHKSGKYRHLYIGTSSKTLARTREKFRQEEYLARYKLRASRIERFFGHVKHNLKFTQWYLRGKSKVKTEGLLLAIGYNLMLIRRKSMATAVG